MKILVSGGTGFVGKNLVGTLNDHGHEVTVLTRAIRAPLEMPEGVSVMEGDPTKPGHWQEKAADYEVIINLAGAPIFRQWSSKAKQEILHSRILATRNLVEAVAGRKNQETHFLSASGIGYYGFREDEILDESGAPGDDFLATVAVRWEHAAMGAQLLGARLVLCRFGHVLGRSGGVLPRLMRLSKLRLGSYWGNGRQWVSWIHEEDLARTFLYLLERKDIVGPTNVTAPGPVRNRELTELLSRCLHIRPLLPPVPSFSLRLLSGEFATVFLKGQRVVPQRLLDSGFAFKFATLDGALRELLASDMAGDSEDLFS